MNQMCPLANVVGKTNGHARQRLIMESKGRPLQRLRLLSPQYSSRAKGEETAFSKDKPRDLNDAMERAGRLASSDLRRAKAKRYHSHDMSQSSVTSPSEDFARNNDANLQHRSKRTPSTVHTSDASRPEDLT